MIRDREPSLCLSRPRRTPYEHEADSFEHPRFYFKSWIRGMSGRCRESLPRPIGPYLKVPRYLY